MSLRPLLFGWSRGHVLQLRPETVAVRRRMNMVLGDYDGQMIPGDECRLNFLTFVLQLRKNSWKTSTKNSFMFRLVLGSTQPPIKWAPGAFPGVKAAERRTSHPNLFLVPWLWICVDPCVHIPRRPSWPVMGIPLLLPFNISEVSRSI